MGTRSLLVEGAQCYNLFFFFFNDTATTEIYTLSLHDALPISPHAPSSVRKRSRYALVTPPATKPGSRTMRRWSASVIRDRKSTRLNSSHGYISYAVFCLKKKKKTTRPEPPPAYPPTPPHERPR